MMGCCGETIKQVKNMAVGYSSLASDIKYDSTDLRISKCHSCDEQTWLSSSEYAAWLLRHGIKVLTNFSQLEKLPKLPKYEQGPGRRNLYCRICKCFVPAKARAEGAKCSLGKWEGI